MYSIVLLSRHYWLTSYDTVEVNVTIVDFLVNNSQEEKKNVEIETRSLMWIELRFIFLFDSFCLASHRLRYFCKRILANATAFMVWAAHTAHNSCPSMLKCVNYCSSCRTQNLCRKYFCQTYHLQTVSLMALCLRNVYWLIYRYSPNVLCVPMFVHCTRTSNTA